MRRSRNSGEEVDPVPLVKVAHVNDVIPGTAKVVQAGQTTCALFNLGGTFYATNNDTCRSAAEILRHIGDLLEWALWLAKGTHRWRDAEPQSSWEADVDRFFEGLRRLDEYLAADAPLGYPPEKLFQGPIADALNHVGQIATLRRLTGSPVRGENYFKAEIVVGSVGAEQSSKRVEFD